MGVGFDVAAGLSEIGKEEEVKGELIAMAAQASMYEGDESANLSAESREVKRKGNMGMGNGMELEQRREERETSLK